MARAGGARGRTFGGHEYVLSAGRACAFVEVVEPPVPLVVFGAGSDTLPVARLAREVGWEVTIVDHRPASATPERFPEADALVICRSETVAERVRLDGRTAAVLMTHNYEHDRALLKTLLESPAPYVGCLGPRRRTERMLAELREAGFAPTEERLTRVHAPVG
ncbi:MAG: XdhC family protein, partial [Pyrinomonadaceae bacterium]